MGKNNRFTLSKEKKVSRRQFLSKSALGFAGATASAVCLQSLNCNPKGEELAGKSQPNILIMISDDTGWRDVGYHGSEIKTPNIDRLAQEDIEFDQFYVSPVCSPTRAALLTGRPPSRYNILGAIAGKSKQALPKTTITLAELLRRNGYTTGITGKWHLGLSPEVGPRQYGFDHTYGYFHGQLDQFTHIYKNGDRTWHRNDEFIEEEGHATDLIANEAIRFIKELRDKTKPFFLYVPFSVPHYPLQEEDEWTDLYRDLIENKSRRVFAASMTHMDDAIGRILSTLDAEQLRKDTIVIFISDNGGQQRWIPTTEYEGRHGPNDRLGDNLPLRGWKGQLYEGGIRVPAVLSWRGRLKSRKVTEVISVCDIFPTIAYLAGTPISDDMKIEGANVWPALTGGSILGERMLYWRTGRQLALRKGDWKLVHNGKSLDEGSDELFNLPEDPYETKDLADENRAKVLELRKELAVQLSMD